MGLRLGGGIAELAGSHINILRETPLIPAGTREAKSRKQDWRKNRPNLKFTKQALCFGFVSLLGAANKISKC